MLTELRTGAGDPRTFFKSGNSAHQSSSLEAVLVEGSGTGGGLVDDGGGGDGHIDGDGRGLTLKQADRSRRARWRRWHVGRWDGRLRK